MENNKTFKNETEQETMKLVNAHLEIHLDLFALLPNEEAESREEVEKKLQEMVSQMIQQKVEKHAIQVSTNEIFDMGVSKELKEKYQERILNDDEFWQIRWNGEEKDYTAFYD